MRILDVKNSKTQSIISSNDGRVFEFLHIVERERERERVSLLNCKFVCRKFNVLNL